MKVLFINTHDVRGGAAIVASRLRKVLKQEYGLDSSYVVADKRSEDSDVYQTRNKIGTLLEKVIDKVLNKLGFQYLYFPLSSRAIENMIEQFQPDVISLHNTHGGYFPTNLLTKISQKAPIVWTLHDMWSFTGNAAHTFGDTSWKSLQNSSHLKKIYPSIGFNTGSRLLQQKKNIYNDSNITIVTPSKWLYNLAIESPVFQNKNIIHVNNGLDLALFRPRDKGKSRRQLNIPEQAKVLMFSADYLKNNAWKGGDGLINVLNEINQKLSEKIHLILIGSGEIKGLQDLANFTVSNTGYIKSEEIMASYLSAADLFIYPTRADNLPNVLVEAISCGLPCVTFDVGGCSEIIVNELNGLVVKEMDYADMSFKIIELLCDESLLKEMSLSGRIYAEKNFSIEQMGQEYMKVFRSLIKKV